MRWIGIIFAALLLAGTADAVKRHPYRREYVHATYGKRGWAGVGARAGLAQVRRSPKQWGGGGAGFGKRLGSAAGTHIIKNSIQYGVAGLRHEDLHYHRSNKKQFGPRLKHALVSTVVTRKTTTGKKTVAAGRISGAMGSGAIASTWAPAAAGGAATGGISLGATATTNVAREFWPRKKHRPQRN
jgi:hypothetical protein